MKQNIYDQDAFFDEYYNMRITKKGISANDAIEIPTIRKMIPDLKGKRVLELGCGYGENCSYFIQKGASYVLGTDISHNMINLAKARTTEKNIDYQVLAMEDIDQLKDKFDFVISSLAIHYVEDFEKLLKDVYTLLNDNGYFLFSQEHPIVTSLILNKECNGETKVAIGNKTYYLVSDYNRSGKRIVDWNHHDVVKYHRNFSFIINTILKCGFQIEEILEPVPNDVLLEKAPKYNNQFDRPYFLFVKLSKNVKSK